MPPSCPAARPTTVTSVVATALASALGVCGTLVVAALVTPNAAGAATTPSAQAKYQATIKAIAHRDMHLSSTLSQNGVTIDVSVDTGATSGKQSLVLHNGSLTERVSTMVVGPTGYINGNKVALHHVIGLSTAQSAKYAGKWLSFPKSNTGLKQLVFGLLNSEVSSEIQMSAPYRYAPAVTIDGQRALTIRGDQATQGGSKVATILYVPATGTPLPIKEVTNPGNKGGKHAVHGTVTFSHWGEKTHEQKPAHSVSLLKLVPSASGSATTTTTKG